ncbi:MAG: hemolysin family protein [Streptosporangiaceae bacterium]
MNSVGWDIVIVSVIILIGGFFAGAEMAMVSLREGQVRALGKRGKRGQRAARLAQDPNRFLSAVQIGVTVATLLSGAFGAATLASALRRPLSRHMSAGLASVLSVVAVTLVISVFTLIFGELAPKRIALQRNERVSLFAAPVLDRLATLARPLVWLLSRATNLVVRLAGGDPKIAKGVMTEQELRDLVAGNQTLSADERYIMGEVIDAGKRQIREVLVPRTEVEFLPAVLPLADAAQIVAKEPYSRFPVYQESYDDVIGFVHARDLLDPAADPGRPVGEMCRPVKFLPASKTVLSALSEMRSGRAHLAIVVDEYGGTAGIVTLEDLVEELIGDIQDEYDVDGGQPRQLRGGELEVDGLLNLDEFAEQTGIELPEGPYETVAGYLLAVLGHLPAVGESVEQAGRKLTVTQLDGRRIARLRVGAAGGPAPGPGSGTGATASPGTSPAAGPRTSRPAGPGTSTPAGPGTSTSAGPGTSTAAADGAAPGPDAGGASAASPGAGAPATGPSTEPGPPEPAAQQRVRGPAR